MVFIICWSSSHLDAGSTRKNVGNQIPKIQPDFVANAPQSIVGRPKLIEFWATWCGPCVDNIPHLNKVHRSYSSKGLVVIGFTKEAERKVKDFVVSEKMEYPIAIDRGGRLQNYFGVKGIPHALLVDGTGKILWEGHPSDLKDKAIEEAIKGSPPPTPRKLPKVL
ncbi:MAG: TlpA disulfide reductase family protein [Verrucomicrobiota bacterium]